MTNRSSCAIAYTLEVVGDKWSLLIVRDIALRGFQTYGDFLLAEEKISSNILANRLSDLEKIGIISKSPDPFDGRKEFYALTKKGVDLLPVILEMLVWGSRYFNGDESPKWFVQRAKQNRGKLVHDIQRGIQNNRHILTE